MNKITKYKIEIFVMSILCVVISLAPKPSLEKVSMYYTIIAIITLIFYIDLKVYKNTSRSITRTWPWWKYLPCGSIIARYKYHKTG